MTSCPSATEPPTLGQGSGQALPRTGRFDKLRTGFFSTCNVITSAARLEKGCGKLELIPCKLELMMICADFLTTLMSASQAALPCNCLLYTSDAADDLLC